MAQERQGSAFKSSLTPGQLSLSNANQRLAALPSGYYAPVSLALISISRHASLPQQLAAIIKRLNPPAPSPMCQSGTRTLCQTIYPQRRALHITIVYRQPGQQTFRPTLPRQTIFPARSSPDLHIQNSLRTARWRLLLLRRWDILLRHHLQLLLQQRQVPRLDIPPPHHSQRHNTHTRSIPPTSAAPIRRRCGRNRQPDAQPDVFLARQILTTPWCVEKRLLELETIE